MYNHEPHDYVCPFCLLAQGGASALSNQRDVIFRDDSVTAFVPSHFWENNKGHVIVIPNQHFENIYDLPDELRARIHRVARQVALAQKECYGCDGVSTRQHNEPVADSVVAEEAANLQGKVNRTISPGEIGRQTRVAAMDALRLLIA